jgi:hypothetical protein
MIRICWENKVNGSNGSRSWHPDDRLNLLKQCCVISNKRFPRIHHWIEFQGSDMDEITGVIGSDLTFADKDGDGNWIFFNAPVTHEFTLAKYPPGSNCGFIAPSGCRPVRRDDGWQWESAI